MSALSVVHTYMLYVLGTFLLLVKKGSYVSSRVSLFHREGQSEHQVVWRSAVLAHLFHNLGAASRTDGMQFAAYITLLESWIFVHFPKLPDIPKEQHSDATEYCTRLCGTHIGQKDGLWKEWIVKSRDRGRRLKGEPAQCVEGYMQWFQSVSWTKICPPTVDLSADEDIGLSACHPIGRVRSKSNNCDIPMEVSEELPNVYEHEQYHMLREENKLAVIPKGEAVPSRDLLKKIDKLTVKYEDVVKRLKEKESFINLFGWK
ncbi:hypothetical protein GIB67_005327 [Kingdonia uniflora]|uniref:Aminotransferase-like plant mobile domain-containing protein n=1 Tax=Kingdonia uniflora TaxID=39325 RepID=A0A7J7NDL0_9MAGN|nr:hypothetical protein GIB67_005327 [Kingdonia uniflora]